MFACEPRPRPTLLDDRGATPTVDTSRLHRLPWSAHDNPNGWIEPTTRCQLRCPGCYRGCDAPDFEGGHRPVADVKEEIDELIDRRRISALSIAGGEPLLYPDLDEIIAHGRARGLEVQLVSNGIGLVDERLRELRRLGLARVCIHVDRHQGRFGIRTEHDANRLREEHCETFRRVGGVALGFIQPLSDCDVDDLDVLVPFFKKNSDVISLVTFNRMQPANFVDVGGDRVGDASAIIDRVRQLYGLEWSAYLPKTRSKGVSWLYSQAILCGETVVGSLDAQAFRAIQEDHRRRTGQYLHTSRKAHVGLRTLAQAPFNRSMWRTLASWWKVRRPGDRLRLQLVLIVNTPTLLADGDYDRCDGCPDAMLHEGQLVPSCLLEQIKRHGVVAAT